MDIQFKVTAAGVTYPALMTMGAMYDFKKRTGKDISQADDGDMLDVIYFCVKSVAEREGRDLPFNADNFGHFLDIDEGAAAITAYVDAVNNAAKKKK